MPSFIRATGPDGWLAAAADLGRLLWAALYWNCAKTWYRARGRRGRAPCQHPSDSGREGESFCEACVDLADPRRFARICPLIRFDSPRGPRCSVAAQDVRPFWGRVLAVGGIGGAIAAVLLLISALTAFHAIGYRIRVNDLAWPGHWQRIRAARADYYCRRGVAAYSRGDLAGCYLALFEAHALRPGDFPTDRLLAQVAQVANPAFADQLYEELVQSPDALLAANASQEWGASLLARGNFAPLARLSSHILRRGSFDSAAAWTNALIFSTARLGSNDVVRQLLAQPGALPTDCRTALEWSLQPDRDSLSAELLSAGQRSPSLYLRDYALGRLIRSGQAIAVLDALNVATGLPPREIEALRLAAWGALRWTQVRRMEIERLIGAGELPPAVAELLAAQLILYPDRIAGGALLAAARRRPFPAVMGNYRVYAALLCVAAVDRDGPRLNQLTEILARISGHPFGQQNGVAEIFLDRTPGRSIVPALVALQPLSLEIMFAMLADYPRMPGPPADEP